MAPQWNGGSLQADLAGSMLTAGDKAGNWTRWYKKNIPVADDLFDDHLCRLRGE